MSLLLDGTNGETFPSWTTAGRPASPAVGQMGYNTTIGQFDAYTASGWVSVANSGNAPVSGPAFSYYQSVQQTGITASTWTKITFTSSLFDTTGGMYSSSRFTPTVAGYYQLNGSIQLTGANAAYFVAGAFYKNGSNYAQFTLANGNTNYYCQSTGSSVIYFNGTTDYVEVYAFGTASGAWSAYNSQPATYFNAALIRSA